MKHDSDFMLEALALARMAWGMTNPNPMVGCVIVKDGKIIGRGFHRKAGEPHAEVNALRDAVEHGNDPQGATLYVTLEPCSSFGRTPPCTEAIINAKVAKVVIGALDPNPKHAGRGVKQLQERGIECVCGVENRACCDLNRHFFRWITSGKPFVILKMATTLDGKTAAANGESRWVTGVEARRRVQQLRRLADAIMVGGNTLRTDRPQLTVRDVEAWQKQPLRIVASSTLTDDDLAEYFPDGRAEVVNLPDAAAWEGYLRQLGARNISVLLIEGGSELAFSAIKADAVDMVEFHIAPKLLGGRDSIPALGGDSPGSMADALPLQNITVTRYGDDIAIQGFLRED